MLPNTPNTDSQAASRQTALRPDLQILRALAILLVVLYHCDVAFLSGGYVGVDVFFVLSGYLITRQLLGMAQAGTGMREFWARRARRLAPAYTLVLAGTLWATYMFLSPLEQRELAEAYQYSAVYLSNLWFATTELDYLSAESSLNPVLHTWSLGVEEQFYLFWPWLILALTSVRKRQGHNGGVKLVLAAILLGSLALCIWLTDRSQPQAFYYPVTRIWQFAAGALVAIFFTSSQPPVRGKALASAGMVAGIGLILGSGIWFDNTTLFPGFWAILPVAGTVLFILCAPSLAIWDTHTAMRLLARIGDYSYSWYLLHWPILVLGASVWGLASVSEKLSLAGLSLALSHLMYTWIENPIRHNRALTRSPMLSIGLAIAAALSLYLGSIALDSQASAVLASPPFIQLQNVRKDNPVIYANDCHQDKKSSSLGANCDYGDPSGTRLAYLFGDSHAAQWMPALDKEMRTRGWRLRVMTKSACPFAQVTPTKAKGGVYTECSVWRSKVLADMQAHNPDLVLVATASRTLTNPMHGISDQQWETGIADTLSRLSDLANRVIIIQDLPEPPRDAPVCMARMAWRNVDFEACSFELAASNASSMNAINERVARSYPNVRAVAMSDLICSNGKCNVGAAGQPIFRDKQHLAASWTTQNSAPIWQLLGIDVGH